jgi:hypothetical protein
MLELSTNARDIAMVCRTDDNNVNKPTLTSYIALLPPSMG